MRLYIIIVSLAVICSCAQAFLRSSRIGSVVASNRRLSSGSLSNIFGSRRNAGTVPRVSVRENARKLDGFLMSTFGGSSVGTRGISGTSGFGHRRLNKGQPQPTSKFDVVFLLDSSGSIGSEEFLKAKQFISEIVDLLPTAISRDTTRIAAISFSQESQIKTEFDFLAHSDKNSIIRAINSIRYQNGPSTHTARALGDVKELFDRQGRAGAEKALFVVTDGRSNGGRDPAVPARAMKNTDRDDVKIVVVAVSNNINMQEIRSIASSPPDEHIYYVSTFTEATDVSREVHRRMQARFNLNRRSH